MNDFSMARAVLGPLFLLASLGTTLGAAGCHGDEPGGGASRTGDEGVPPAGGEGDPLQPQPPAGKPAQAALSLAQMCFPRPPPVETYEPLPPSTPVATACEVGRDVTGRPSSVDDTLSRLAGRWALCAGDVWSVGFGAEHVGIEFNGRGRWQMLL
ncbi:MAG TPA: hypothetical protein VFS00_02325, partial [Polyangiaceae bacterium]|nr:hypothetical protein [Polyangiaceae bacterium]